MTTETQQSLRAQADTLTDMLAGALRRAGEAPDDIELACEVDYLDARLEEVLLGLRGELP